MGTRIEVTRRLFKAYQGATKTEKSAILDEFCAVTGLSRVSAKRYLTDPSKGDAKVVKLDGRKIRACKYSLASRAWLVHIWMIMGMPCGKYMAQGLGEWIDNLAAFGHLSGFRPGGWPWSSKVEEELRAMSGATIDRYLRQEREKRELKGISTTKRGTLLRNSVRIRKAGDQVEGFPGFVEADTVAHCGPANKGEFARTLTVTDVHTGWVHLEVLRNNASKWMLQALDNTLAAFPFPLEGLDCDNGSEFINHDVFAWAADHHIWFTRSRPYKKNDQANVESKNNHVVRKYAFYYRYDTDAQRRVLARLLGNVEILLNFFMPTKKPDGYISDTTGRARRTYDTPATPLQRLIGAGVLSPAQVQELLDFKKSIDLLELARDIRRDQDMLISLAKEATEKLLTEKLLHEEKRAAARKNGIRVKTA